MENPAREKTCSLPAEQDVHHICFQRRKWSKGYARLLRRVFARRVPSEWHCDLHKELRDVPVPNDMLLWQAWIDYQRDKDRVNRMDICQAIAWLYVHIPDVEFRKAMQFQLDFFAAKYQETVK